jgi:hypothetical protein
MQRRCHDPKNKDFHLYGGRGVRVCDEWNLQAGGSFENFLADMGERPEGTTLDKDKLGGNGCLLYSPETCCWLTPQEQTHNTRRNRMIAFQGRTQCVSAWEQELGLGRGTLWGRLRRCWSIEKALTQPVSPRQVSS